MAAKKTTFALLFGNRGFFPASLQAGARKQMSAALKKLGHETLIMPKAATRYGAIETPTDGQKYAKFLAENRGNFGGVIVCLPNFGDETGAIAALKDCGVPILIQAYPDELDKMAPELRRDAFCGKFSVMDVFCQYGLKFTCTNKHVVSPTDPSFTADVDRFDRLCRVVGGMREMTVGAIGARTTAFKTVRIDELALQRHNITMETLDLSDVFARMNGLKKTDKKVKSKASLFKKYASWKGVPAASLDKISRLAVVIDDLIDEYQMDAIALRCWVEMQQQLGISPCVILSELNNRGFVAACEVDVGNAVAMRALNLASGDVATCLDWNNNYGDEDDKCILFHCGPVPDSMMTCRGKITDHAILANAVGKGCSFGCNVGRIAPTDMTFSSMLTEAGKLKFYIGEGRFTDDEIASDYFGCAGVAEIPNLQDTLRTIGYLGHRHHVSLTPGHVAGAVTEALEKYLGYEVTTV